MIRDLEKSFKALADSNRLRILKMLQRRSLCVCEITEILGLATSTVSKHLSILREAGFITSEKDGRWVNYTLADEPSNQYAHPLLEDLNRWLEEDSLVDFKKVENVNRDKICST